MMPFDSTLLLKNQANDPLGHVPQQIQPEAQLIYPPAAIQAQPNVSKLPQQPEEDQKHIEAVDTMGVPSPIQMQSVSQVGTQVFVPAQQQAVQQTQQTMQQADQQAQSPVSLNNLNNLTHQQQAALQGKTMSLDELKQLMQNATFCTIKNVGQNAA